MQHHSLGSILTSRLGVSMLLFFLFPLSLIAAPRGGRITEHKLRIIHTTDVHGNIYPQDFLNNHAGTGSMSRLSTVMKQVRRQDPEALLLDAGDLLQGEPPTYYYNYVDTVSPHIVASAMNYLRYDAVAMGNHDIEPGHSVFSRWGRECKFPLLGANIISEATGKPYFKPYQIFRRSSTTSSLLLGSGYRLFIAQSSLTCSSCLCTRGWRMITPII